MRRMDKRLIEAGCVTHATVKWDDGEFVHPYLWKPDAIKDEVAVQLTGYKLVDNSEYCQSWDDPREKAVETARISSIASSSIGNTFAEVGKSVGDNTTDFGNVLADAGSTVGELFDIQLPNQAEEQPLRPRRKIIKKKKGKGFSPS